MKMTFAPACLAALALLAACGGGGSTGGNPPPTITPSNPPPTQTPATTTVAQGTVVDDKTGSALSGVKVQLDPWVAFATPGPTPTPIATTTTDANGHFTINAANGTYLLVIGPDTVNTPPPGFVTPSPAATDTPIPGATGWQATVHDRIVLTGGGTVSSPIPLVAPTMIPQPHVTPPATETSGHYRIATLDALTEAPCILAYNQERAALGLPLVIADEWLTENVRVIEANHNNAQLPTSDSIMSLANERIGGGNNCAQMVYGANNAFQNGAATYSENPNATWFGGIYAMVQPGGFPLQGYGTLEFPIDPRVYTDQSFPTWP